MTSLAAPLAYLDAASLPQGDPDRACHPWKEGGAGDAPPRRGRPRFADRCAAIALDLRTTLEDRLPRLAALAACWFEDEEEEGNGDGAAGDAGDWPANPVSLRIDLRAFAAGLVRRDGRPVTLGDAEAFLAVAGFRRFGDFWVGDRQDLRLIGSHGVREIGAPAESSPASTTLS